MHIGNCQLEFPGVIKMKSCVISPWVKVFGLEFPRGVRDCCWQITFVTLNRFCLLQQKIPPFLFLTANIKMDRIPTKIKWKINMLFLHCISGFEGTSFKKIVRYSHQTFYFMLFLLVFTSADIIFHNFLELHSALSEKRFSSQISLFSWIHSPTLLMDFKIR